MVIRRRGLGTTIEGYKVTHNSDHHAARAESRMLSRLSHALVMTAVSKAVKTKWRLFCSGSVKYFMAAFGPTTQGTAERIALLTSLWR